MLEYNFYPMLNNGEKLSNALLEKFGENWRNITIIK
jgi:hypothetical protein